MPLNPTPQPLTNSHLVELPLAEADPAKPWKAIVAFLAPAVIAAVVAGLATFVVRNPKKFEDPKRRSGGHRG